MTKVQNNTDRKQKSVKLSKDEFKALKNLRKGFSSDYDCALFIGIERPTMNRVLSIGRGNSDTIEAIKNVISQVEEKTGVQSNSTII